MNKRIEVGCMCVILHDDDHAEIIGKTCTVIGRTDTDSYYNATTFERIKPGAWDIEIDGNRDKWWAYQENLLRIDDYDASQDEVTHDEEMTL